MFDDLEDGPRLAMWLVVGLLGLTLLGVVGGLMLREWRPDLGQGSSRSLRLPALDNARASLALPNKAASAP